MTTFLSDLPVSVLANRVGLPEREVGNLIETWKPDTETLTIHYVTIHRGGQTIDELAGGRKFIVLRRENNLELAMLDGALTVRKVAELTLAFDHRVCDGGTAGGFLRYIADRIESPILALADL